jgi:hypothetical protein
VPDPAAAAEAGEAAFVWETGIGAATVDD